MDFDSRETSVSVPCVSAVVATGPIVAIVEGKLVEA